MESRIFVLNRRLGVNSELRGSYFREKKSLSGQQPSTSINNESTDRVTQ